MINNMDLYSQESKSNKLHVRCQRKQIKLTGLQNMAKYGKIGLWRWFDGSWWDSITSWQSQC